MEKITDLLGTTSQTRPLIPVVDDRDLSKRKSTAKMQNTPFENYR
jgi:hypothetical protein